VEAASRWLRTRASKVGALGLSLGGNLVVLATANGWADAGVAVSTSSERLSQLAGGRAKGAKATLFLASENDTDRARSAQALAASAAEPKKALILPGSAHNLELLADARARRAAFDWLTERLGVLPATPTPTPVFVTAESTGFPSAASASPTPTPTPTPTASLPAGAPAPTPELSPFGGVVVPSPAPPSGTPPTPPAR